MPTVIQPPQDDGDDDLDVPVEETGPEEEPLPEGYVPPGEDRDYTRAGDRDDTDDDDEAG